MRKKNSSTNFSSVRIPGHEANDYLKQGVVIRLLEKYKPKKGFSPLDSSANNKEFKTVAWKWFIRIQTPEIDTFIYTIPWKRG